MEGGREKMVLHVRFWPARLGRPGFPRARAMELDLKLMLATGPNFFFKVLLCLCLYRSALARERERNPKKKFAPFTASDRTLVFFFLLIAVDTEANYFFPSLSSALTDSFYFCWVYDYRGLDKISL